MTGKEFLEDRIPYFQESHPGYYIAIKNYSKTDNMIVLLISEEEPEWIEDLHTFSVEGLLPNETAFIKLSPEIELTDFKRVYLQVPEILITTESNNGSV